MNTTQRESPPSATNAERTISNQVATGELGPSVVDPVDSRADFTQLSPEAWDVCMRYYSSGYRKGLERGRELADSEARQLWREAGAVVKGLAGRDARPGSEWMQFATSQELTAAAEKRQADDIARFRGAQAADHAAYVAGGAR